MDYPDKLSAAGKQLLKVLGGDPSLASITPAALKRWAVDQPTSIINLCPDEVLTRAAVHLPENYFRRTEAELIKEMPYEQVSRQDRRVRIQFWEEYEAAAKDNRPMDLEFVAQGTGAVNWPAFRDELVTCNAKLAWLMIPPAHYRVQLKEAQELGLGRLMNILEIPAQDPVTKKVNVGIAMMHLMVWKAIDLRLQGPMIQKIVSLTGNMGSAPEGGSAKVDMTSVDKRIAELEAQLQGTPQAEPDKPAEIVDVKSEVL